MDHSSFINKAYDLLGQVLSVTENSESGGKSHVKHQMPLHYATLKT